MTDKYKRIKKVHFTEIPSIKYLNNTTICLKDGLHVYVTNDKDEQHKCYMSEQFKTDIRKFKKSIFNYTKHDITAICVYRYINNLAFTKCSKRILWKMLRYSNNLIISLVKFLEILD